MLGPKKSDEVMKWENVSERILAVEFGKGYNRVTVFMAYRPNKDDKKVEKNSFWSSLLYRDHANARLQSYTARDHQGDLNERVGNFVEKWQGVRKKRREKN